MQDAKNKFSAVVDAASKGTPQTVTKRGKPAVVVLSIQEYERLNRPREPARSFVEHLFAMPKDDGAFERAEIEPRDVEL
ncbi:MAG TPA: type II toxin-antitoxin system Phd/YefM family antitoxin [Stellaceae bacterium]